MAYVVVVFAIINSLALGWGVLILLNLRLDLMESVETVIQDEVRKQDERIEKRRQRADGPAEDKPETPVDGVLRAGLPFRR